MVGGFAAGEPVSETAEAEVLKVDEAGQNSN